MQPALINDKDKNYIDVQHKIIFYLIIGSVGLVIGSVLIGMILFLIDLRKASPELILEASKNPCVKHSILTSNSKNGALRIVDIDDFEHDCTLKREFEEQTHLITDKTKGVFSAPEPTPQ